jgi:hypothetical protein
MIDAVAELVANDPITLLSSTLRCQPNGKELAANMYRRLYARLQCKAKVQKKKTGAPYAAQVLFTDAYMAQAS